VATICSGFSRGVTMRLTRLDVCGVPVVGACTTVVSSGFVSVEVSPQYIDPTEIEQLNANGEACVIDQTCPQFKWDELEMVFCNVNPNIWNIITGDALVLNDNTPTADTVGFRQSGQDLCTANFALEIWTQKPGQPCTDPDMKEYGYWLFPFVVQGTVGDWTFENDALTLTLNARTSGGSGWGTGPATYLVRRDAVTDTPEVLLTAIGPNDHMHHEVVTVAPPTPACDCIALA
jgi:hypothetical protein